MSHSMSEIVGIPKGVLATAETLGDIEDWLAANDPEFLAEMRRIRQQEDLDGQGVSLEEAAAEWGVEL